MKKFIFFGVVSICFSGKSQLFTSGSGLIDIDGNVYTTIIINDQEWMAENLNTTSYSDGSAIPNLSDSTQWSNTISGAWCYFNNDILTENPYGKLYNWYVVADTRNICPTGWHVPSDLDWKLLVNYLDSNANGGLSPNISGGLLKSTGTIQASSGLWNSPNTGATNESGFTALPNGQRNNNALFEFMGSYAYFWTSDQIGQSNAIFFVLFNMSSNALRSNHNKAFGKNIRCLKNQFNDLNEVIIPTSKQIIKITDLLGRETEPTTNEILIYQYSDGTVEKKMIFD